MSFPTNFVPPPPSPLVRARVFLTQRVVPFYIVNFLPIMLIVLVVFGALVPAPGRFFQETELKTFCVSAIFTITGMFFKIKELLVFHAWPAVVYGLLTILVITPQIGWLLLMLDFEPPELRIGLLLFFCMPTTLTSGVALTTQAKGNTALAVFLTATTNVIGVFTVSFWLSLLINSSDMTVTLDPVPLLLNLLLLVLLPLVFGKVITLIKVVEDVVTPHKKKFSLLSNFLLVLIPWMAISDSADSLRATEASNIVLVVVAGVVVHLIYLVFNYAVTVPMKLPADLRKPVVLIGSQKTMPVAMSVLALLPDSMGSKGLIAIPPIVAHLSQLIIDAFIVVWWQEDTPVFLSCFQKKTPPQHAEPAVENGGADAGPSVDPDGTSIGDRYVVTDSSV